MANDPLNRVIRDLRRQAFAGAGMSDGQLLECYLSRRDNAALEALVGRHGPMVWSVCRRILHNHHDAEDAYQATFLVLVRRAAAVVPRDRVANWLYGVAQQTALSARATLAKRRSREVQTSQSSEPEAFSRSADSDLWSLLDRELNRLPAKYRVAIIVCDWEGKSRKAAARQLGVPEGTVASRLARARELLAKRLTRRGVTLSATALASAFAKEACAYVPPAVAAVTFEAMTTVAAGKAGGVLSASVIALTEGVVRAMVMTKLTRLTAVLVILGVFAIGGGVLQYQMALGGAEDGAGIPGPPAVAQNGDAVVAQAKPKEAQDAGPGKAQAQLAEKPANQPYKIKPLDELFISVDGTPVGRDIKGVFVVEHEGTVRLGPIYGGVRIADLTFDEAEKVIEKHLKSIVVDPKVMVTLPTSQADGKEIGKLRAEIADLRKAIKELQGAIKQSAAPEQAALKYHGKSLASWVEQLNDVDPEFRVPAIHALGALAQKNKDVIPVFVKALKNENEEGIRTMLVDELGKLARDNKELIPVLVSVFKNEPENSNAALAAIRGIQNAGQDVVSLLLDSLQNKSSRNARVNALRAIPVLGIKAKRSAVPVLSQMLEDEYHDIRVYCAAALKGIGDDAKPAIPALIDALGASIQSFNPKDRYPFLPREIFQALLKIDPEIVNVLPPRFVSFESAMESQTEPRFDQWVEHWQRGYKALRSAYPKGK